MKDADQSSSMPSDEAAQELDAVRSAARWLVGSAAALFAVMLAGVQASSIGKIDDSELVRHISAGAAGITGLAAAGAVLWLAARVLVYPGWTVNKLAQLEITDPDKWTKHWVYRELYARRAWLTPTKDLDISLLYKSYRALFIATVELHEKGSCKVANSLLGSDENDTTYSTQVDGDDERLQQRLQIAEMVAERITRTANLADIHRRYQKLVRRIPLLGLVIIGSIVTFIWATTSPNGAPVTSPVRMQIQFEKSRELLVEANLPAECAGMTITGVALGGTLEEPVLTSTNTSTCVLKQKKIPSGVAAVIPDTAR